MNVSEQRWNEILDENTTLGSTVSKQAEIIRKQRSELEGMSPENEAKKAFLGLQSENIRLKAEVREQAEEIENRGDGIDSLVCMMEVLKKKLGATEGETVRHLISHLEKAELADSIIPTVSHSDLIEACRGSGNLISQLETGNEELRSSTRNQATEIRKLEAALASTNPYLPFWVGEAPLNPGPRGPRYAVFGFDETWFIREGKDREESLGLCHKICEMLNRAWSMVRGKE